jgi:hypothetical protein
MHLSMHRCACLCPRDKEGPFLCLSNSVPSVYVLFVCLFSSFFCGKTTAQPSTRKRGKKGNDVAIKSCRTEGTEDLHRTALTIREKAKQGKQTERRGAILRARSCAYRKGDRLDFSFVHTHIYTSRPRADRSKGWEGKKEGEKGASFFLPDLSFPRIRTLLLNLIFPFLLFANSRRRLLYFFF